MKHAVIVAEPENYSPENYAVARLADGRKLYFAESNYTPEGLAAFDAGKQKWILQCKGNGQFTADSDSGEDAHGYYRGYFDLLPEKAVFENGKLVGFYLRPGYMRYSGNGRASFEIDDWGYPGDRLLYRSPWGKDLCVFLFSDAGTHQWDEWSLLERDPEKEYKSYLEF